MGPRERAAALESRGKRAHRDRLDPLAKPDRLDLRVCPVFPAKLEHRAWRLVII